MAEVCALMSALIVVFVCVFCIQWHNIVVCHKIEKMKKKHTAVKYLSDPCRLWELCVFLLE